MTQETWLVVTVGAGFLLMGVAASPLAWVALLHRRNRAESEAERVAEDLAEQLRALQSRIDRCEKTLRGWHEAEKAGGSSTPMGPIVWRKSGKGETVTREDPAEPRLIAVPKLPASADRAAMQGGISHRYAAIWELAESGASADAIARATGQPIGQIELILGLRRQMDNGISRTSIPHASHE